MSNNGLKNRFSVNDSLIEWREKMQNRGESAYRGTQVFMYLHRHYNHDPIMWNQLPKLLRQELKDMDIPQITISQRLVSKVDGTIKYVYELQDDELIEGVLMKYEHGYTLCVSTQVGCAMGCEFCASTKHGRKRQLETFEILNQVYVVEKQEGVSISNVVLMGIGEPLDNWSNVKQFMEILHTKEGKNMSYRNMTVSTCGVVPGIDSLAKWGKPVTLAISLHATSDEQRDKLMPINHRYPIKKLMQTIDHYIDHTGRRVSFEFTIIPGYNDNYQSMDELVALLNHKLCHINLIPLNPIAEFNPKSNSGIGIKHLKEYLAKKGIPTSIRRTLGPDIRASCGQLRQMRKKERNTNDELCGKDRERAYTSFKSRSLSNH